jgi:DNA polymerase-3 subunit epsilon/ATP-dependent DNA helicase DinG
VSASPTVYVALDLEATEMHPERGEIIELGAIKFTPERIVDRWSATVRPRGPIPFAITQLTGITEAEVRRAAPFAAVAPALAAFVRQHPIVGQSAWMDVDMLRAAGLTLANPVLDTFELATLTLPSLPAYSLRQIAGRLGVALPVEHRALADAAVTVEVFRRLLARIRELDAETLGEMARLLGAASSPLAPFWRELAREKTREGFDAPLGGALAGALRRGLADKARAVEPASGVGPESLFLLPRERPERLEPTGKGDPIDPARLRAIFAPGGPFARAFPGFEQRPQQLAMMEAVADILNDGGTLIAEAGTGVGKSLAYLLPAVIHAVTRGETVVISTATINLQDQLFRKDIPDLQHVLATLGDDERGATSDERRATIKGQRARATTTLFHNRHPKGTRSAIRNRARRCRLSFAPRSSRGGRIISACAGGSTSAAGRKGAPRTRRWPTSWRKRSSGCRRPTAATAPNSSSCPTSRPGGGGWPSMRARASRRSASSRSAGSVSSTARAAGRRAPTSSS